MLKKPSLDPAVLSNFRPISNLPFLSKTLERAVASQLMKHLTDNNLLESLQSGFRWHHSTETALLRIVNDLLLNADAAAPSVLVLLDLTAAFDTIDHGILLDHLQKYAGISGTCLSWMSSYLSGRMQSLNLNFFVALVLTFVKFLG